MSVVPDILQSTAMHIPSREQVLELLKDAPSLQTRSNAVVRISDTLVLKHGREVNIWEARNLEFAASVPGVHVPRVYDAWEDVHDENDHQSEFNTYILMEYIEGRTLAEIWTESDDVAREAIVDRVADMLSCLHMTQLDKPGPVGRGFSRGFWFTDYDAGPFATVEELEDWFNQRLQVCKDVKRVAEDQEDFTGRMRELVFCHLDIHTHNILIDMHDQMWLLDFDYAGGYPKYFELAFLQVSFDRYHPDFTENLMTKLKEHVILADISRLQAINFAVTTGSFMQPKGIVGVVELDEIEGFPGPPRNSYTPPPTSVAGLYPPPPPPSVLSVSINYDRPELAQSKPDLLAP